MPPAAQICATGGTYVSKWEGTTSRACGIAEEWSRRDAGLERQGGRMGAVESEQRTMATADGVRQEGRSLGLALLPVDKSGQELVVRGWAHP